MGLAGLDSLSEIMELPPKSVVPIEKMIGDDDEDNILLQQMSKDAEEYIRSFSWCGGILRAFFGGGVGGIFAVFLYQIIPARPDVSSWIWIVGGGRAVGISPNRGRGVSNGSVRCVSRGNEEVDCTGTGRANGNPRRRRSAIQHPAHTRMGREVGTETPSVRLGERFS